MSSTQILQEKSAVMFGAGGSKGAAVAKEFAAQGAELFLSGHTKPGVESVAKQIAPNGGRAQALTPSTMPPATNISMASQSSHAASSLRLLVWLVHSICKSMQHVV